MLHEREHRRFSVEEYFMLEEPAVSKSEYCDGYIYSMSGASMDHNRLVRNCLVELDGALKGSRCEVFPSDLRLCIERQKLITYPDVLVICGKPRFYQARRDTVVDATVLVEVLSPSTQNYDKNEKFQMYRDLPSFADYLLVSQDGVRIEHHHRQGPGRWLMTEHTSIEAEIELSSIQVKLAVKSICRGVFP